MSKGFIVVDNIPEMCGNCKMCFENEYYDQFECYFMPGENIKPDEEKRPDWCPIKPMPERRDEHKTCYNSDYYRAEGWNSCLDEIEQSSIECPQKDSSSSNVGIDSKIATELDEY